MKTKKVVQDCLAIHVRQFFMVVSLSKYNRKEIFFIRRRKVKMKTLRKDFIFRAIIAISGVIVGFPLGSLMIQYKEIVNTVVVIGILLALGIVFVCSIVALSLLLFLPPLLDLILLFSCNNLPLYFYICKTKLGRHHKEKCEKMGFVTMDTTDEEVLKSSGATVVMQGKTLDSEEYEPLFERYLSTHRMFRCGYRLFQRMVRSMQEEKL